MRTVSIPREQIFQGPLVLVNRAHPLHEKERSALTSVDPHHPDILLEAGHGSYCLPVFKRRGDSGRSCRCPAG